MCTFYLVCRLTGTCLGFSQQTRGAWHLWKGCFEEAAAAGDIPVPGLKKFTPKFPDIPTLKEYKAGGDGNFWSKFPVNLSDEVKPEFSHVALAAMVDRLGCSDRARVDRVLEYLRIGAEIGCKGIYRSSTSSSNASSAYECGREVTDALAGWIADGYAYGPVEEEEVPAEAKVNGIMVKKKPNGSARVILNLSAPAGMSVNDGITAEDFPAVMSSAEAWIRVLNKAGKGCWIAKTDWASAYKQIPVRQGDTNLQWFEWAGKFFKELCLIFGSASSAGIFDDAAKVVLDLVCRLAGFPADMICQHLDDICAAAAAKEVLDTFDNAFMETARELGVKLAPRDDHDKTFGPCQKGVVFGIEYDTAEWTWQLPEEKKVRIVAAIREVRGQDTVTDKQAQSLVGKLVNIRPLIPAGRYNADKIMALLAASSKSKVVVVDAECHRQLRFWETALLACNGRLSIPEAAAALPPWAADIYTDAAGGTLDNQGRGTGGVCGRDWFYMPWSARVNGGSWKVDGKKVGRKLSALELVGPLVALVVFARQCRLQPVRIWVDNAGSVRIWNKGYSSFCRLSTTLVKAISVVAAGLGCRVDIVKITRCSTEGAVMADKLSKGDLQGCFRVGDLAGLSMAATPTHIPEPLLRWACLPVPDDNLGHVLLEHLASKGVPVMGY